MGWIPPAVLDFSKQTVVGLNVPVGPGSVTTGSFAPTALSGALRWFNVDDYGADPTGATSSMTAVTAALNAARAYGSGIVRFGPGSYVINGTLPQVSNQIYVEGAGFAATTLFQQNLSAPILQLTGALGCGIARMKLAYASPATGSAAVVIASANGVMLFDVQTVNGYVGFSFYNTSVVYMTRCSVGTATSGLDGIAISCASNASANNYHITDCIVSGGGVTQSTVSQGVALHLSNVQGVYVNNCDFIGYTLNLSIDPTSAAQTVYNLFFSNCSFDVAYGSCASIIPGANATVYLVSFANCWTCGSLSGAGLNVNGSASGAAVDTLQLTGHRANNANTGLAFASASNILLDNCMALCNRAGASGGLYFTNCSDVSVVGGKSGNSAVAYPAALYPTQQSVGLTLGASNARMSFLGLDLQGNTSGPVSGATLGARFDGCAGFNPRGGLTVNNVTGVANMVSGTVYQNLVGVDVTMYVSGGNVSQMNGNGVTIAGPGTGTNVGTLFIPAGGLFTITYTTAPTVVAFAGN